MESRVNTLFTQLNKDIIAAFSDHCRFMPCAVAGFICVGVFHCASEEGTGNGELGRDLLSLLGDSEVWRLGDSSKFS